MAASSLQAVAFFWLTPFILAVGTVTYTTYVLGNYDPSYGQAISYQFALAMSICPSSINAMAFAVALSSVSPVASTSGRRLNVISAALGVVVLIGSLLLATVMFNTMALDTEVFLIVPPVVAFLVPRACIRYLMHLGWLRQPPPNICAACGYDLTLLRSDRCPECGMTISGDASGTPVS